MSFSGTKEKYHLNASIKLDGVFDLLEQHYFEIEDAVRRGSLNCWNYTSLHLMYIYVGNSITKFIFRIILYPN